MIRNIVKDERIVFGGGAPEISCSLAVAKAADKVRNIQLVGKGYKSVGCRRLQMSCCRLRITVLGQAKFLLFKKCLGLQV